MAHDLTYHPELYGVVAEFTDADELMAAARKVREAGFSKIEAYSPFPIHGLSDAIGFDDNKIKWIIFLGGVFGAFAGFGLQCWVSMYANPFNVGGKPHFSWPAFIPITFECMVLCASFGAVFGMLGLNGLPKPYHPVFEAKRFHLASQDRFFLAIEADDPSFDSQRAIQALKDAGGAEIEEVVG